MTEKLTAKQAKRVADAILAARLEALEECKKIADEVTRHAHTSEEAIRTARVSDRIAALIAKESLPACPQCNGTKRCTYRGRTLVCGACAQAY